MAIKINGELGDVFVDNTVIARIAGQVANKCYGVVGMAARSKRDGIVSLLKPNSMTKGIQVDVENAGIVITLSIIVEYGVNINVISESIMKNVRYTIEKVTGLQVNRVFVKVEDIRVDE
jgi:uncharacterized alkaline shock family protein YloU